MTEALAVTRYTLSVHTPAPEGAVFRIAVAADLHNRSGDAALAAIAREKPDCVVIAGDLIESCRPSELMEREMQGDLRQYSAGKRWLMRTVIRADAVLGGARRDSFDPENRKGFAFLQGAVRLAPVYYGLGNHEQYLSPQTRAQIRQTGATLLENASVPLQTALGKLHMGALTTLPDRKWLSSFCALSGLKVLICHHPEYFERFLDDQLLTLVLAGHAHGGQWRVGNRGVFAPGQGFFPKYTGGLCFGPSGAAMVISRGLANTAHVGRLRNPPELVMVELQNRRS